MTDSLKSYADPLAQQEIDRLRAALARVEAMADAMEHEAPKPQVGGFLADQIRAALAGEGS